MENNVHTFPNFHKRVSKIDSKSIGSLKLVFGDFLQGVNSDTPEGILKKIKQTQLKNTLSNVEYRSVRQIAKLFNNVEQNRGRITLFLTSAGVTTPVKVQRSEKVVKLVNHTIS